MDQEMKKEVKVHP